MAKNRNENLQFRIPIYLRIVAFLIFAACVIVVAYSIYQSRNQPKFVMKRMPAELSKDVVAVVNDYERLELDGQIPRYLVKAAKATTFADNHQELENVYIEVYDETGQNVDKLSANQAVYIPTENKSFRVFFFGSVKIEARNHLIVRSEKISYDESSEIAESEGKTEFELENLSGSALNAKVFVNKSQIELFDDVQIFFHNSSREQETEATEKLQQAQIRSKYAKFDKEKQKIEFQDDVFIALQPKDENGKPAKPIEAKAEKLACFFDHEKIKRLELTGNVEFFQKPTDTDGSYLKANSSRTIADFNGDLNKLELQGNVKVETRSIEGNNLTRASAELIRYFTDPEKLELTENAEISTFQQDKASYLRGNQIKAEFFPSRKIKNAFVFGNAYLKETTAEKVIESSANEMKASYSDKHQLRNAHAIGSASITLTPSEVRDYSKAIVFAPQAIRFTFENGALNQVQTEGRTLISLTAPPNKPNASNRKLTADTIKTFFETNGRELLRAEAIGNVSLDVEPVENSPENYKTNMTATRLDCDFYDGNNIKTCVATKNAKVVQEPFDPNRSRRILTAEKLTADFNRENQQIERYEATGNAKYSEADRNAISNQITFTPQSDGIVRLRGGEPTIWDSKARAKASEIDWDTRNEKFFLRRKVSTTYYNQRQTNGTTPFTNPSAPVYITSTEAEFDHRNEIARYLGNVRVWQENNYVRAEILTLYSKTRRMEGEGKVQSLLYDARQRLPDGREITQPVYASSEKISYVDEQRLLRYEGNVNIKQATDRLKAEIAEIFLNDKNEVKKTVAQKNVVITQPNLIATGDYAEYRADEELVILRGNPAMVQDAQEGQLQGVQMQFYLRENRFLNQGSEKDNVSNGRTRSVYKVRN